MATTEIVTTTRTLPATLNGEIERMGYRLLSALDRLGFVHEDRDGRLFTIRFDAVRCYGSSWAAFHVDAERLWHFSIADLVKPSVLAQLSASLKKPVRALTDPDLSFVVELQPKPKVRLPDRVTLNLEQRPDGELLVPFGVGARGPVWRSLPDVRHAMICGETGAGKSNFLHVALAGLTAAAGPDRLRVALIDPKRHELTSWANIPHLVDDTAFTNEQAKALLGKLVDEINYRGDLLAAVQARDVNVYNRNTAQPLPYILAIVDECLDLVGERALADPLKLIARRGRSVGVLLWCATQHAAALDGMPRVLNVNLVTRIAFRVADPAAARAAGCPGAQDIPVERPGRMLTRVDGAIQELQGYFLSDDDLAAITSKMAGSRYTGPALSATGVALVTWALEQNGGYLGLADIQAQAGLGPREARRLAETWERRGWLVKDNHNCNRRMISDSMKQGRVSGQKADKPTNLTNPANRRQEPDKPIPIDCQTVFARRQTAIAG